VTLQAESNSIWFHVVSDNGNRPSHLAKGLTESDIVSLFGTLMPLGVWSMELDTGHEHWNDALFELFGLPPRREPVNLTEYSRRFHPDDLSVRLQLLEHAVTNKVGYHYRLRMKLKDDAYHYVCCVAAYKPDPNGADRLYGIFFLSP